MVTDRYIWEKFNSAVTTLAAMEAPLRERLEGAWSHLQRIQPEELADEDERERFEAVHNALSHATGGAQTLDDYRAYEVAQEVVSLYDWALRRLVRAEAR